MVEQSQQRSSNVQREYVGNIWERQAWETGTQYAAFLVFRDLGGNRSLDAAFILHSKQEKAHKGAKKARKGAKKAQKSARAGGTFRGWAKNNEWNKRASEYDAFVQRELDAAKLEAQKRAEIEKIQRLTELSLDAAVKMLEKPSLERVRKKYRVESNGQQQLTEIITDQQSVFAPEGLVRFALQTLLPEYFGRVAEENSADAVSKETIVIHRNIIARH